MGLPSYQDGYYFDQFCRVSDVLALGVGQVSGIDWSDSPWEWMVKLHPKTKGVFFESLVRRVLEMNGIPVDDRDGTYHDIRVCGYRVEIKSAFATNSPSLYKNGDGKTWSFIWSGVKADGYDYIFLFGVFPHALKMIFKSREDFLRLNDFREQKYCDSDGLCIPVHEQTEVGKELMGVAGDFEESFSSAVEFFKSKIDGFLVMEDGNTLIGGWEGES